MYVFLHTNSVSGTVDCAGTEASTMPASLSGNTLVLEMDKSNGELSNSGGFGDFNYGSGDRIHDVELENGDFFLAGNKLGSAIISEWSFGNSSSSAQATSTGSNTLNDLEFDANGKPFAVGTTTSNVAFGGPQLNSGTEPVGFAVTFNTSFTVENIVAVGGGSSSAEALAVDAANSRIFIAGNAAGAILPNMHVTALTTGLSNLWTSSFDEGQSQASSISAVDLVLDENGRVVVTGAFNGSTIHLFDNGSSVNMDGNGQNDDLWIGGFNAVTGQCDWLIGAESSQDVSPAALALGSGNAYVVGTFKDALEFYQSSETDLDHSSPGMEAMFAIRFGTQYSVGAEFYRKAVSGTEVEPIADPIAMQLYPNPATDEVLLSYNLNDASAQLQIIAMDGKLVQVENGIMGQGTMTINIEQLPAGIYFVALVSEEEAIARTRLVITSH